MHTERTSKLPLRQHGQLPIIQSNQPVSGHRFEHRPLRRKIALKVDIEGMFYACERYVQIANDLLNDFAPDTVVLVAQQATIGVASWPLARVCW